MKRPLRQIVFFAALVALSGRMVAAQLEIVEFTSTKLRGNPLGDPVTRRIAVFKPGEAKEAMRIPLVVYLPGWGGSSEDAIAQGAGGWFGKVVDQLAARGLLFRIAVVDGRSRYGGSQFLNSTATGDYADYVSEEIVPLLTKGGPATCIIAGHSSGAYGALLLAMAHHDRFPAVVALSPDSDFETTHKALVERPGVRALTAADLAAAMAPAKSARLPADGTARLVVGLCANYAPTAGRPGQFEWLYDVEGNWRAETWKRWLALDPLTLVRQKVGSFAPAQRIYLDGAENDEFGANIGASKICAVLRERPAPVTFYESPGHHSDHLPERLIRGLLWVSGKPAGQEN
jgi:pimeloyl-ACP methyl ester carboxylesterase